MFLRKSVWANGGDFNDPLLLWYAKGVAEIKQRPLSDKTSWRFLAAVHGEDFTDPSKPNYWTQYNYYTPGEPLPSNADQASYWNQCQHQSWYFLPWHRGYLVSLEAIVRDAIIKLGGPADWALPYWDYSSTNPNARQLPPAFSVTTLPDGSPNPLYVSQRYGANPNFNTLPLPVNDVSLKILNNIQFIGISSGGNPGFGGPKTVFHHNGGGSGGLESLPHNNVHGDVGGLNDNFEDPGLMSDPDLAGLDPIFYLHHANIDRLWSFWVSLGQGRANPTDQNWLQGPVSRTFIMPLPDGQGWVYAPKDVITTENLGYIYDPLTNGDVVPPSTRAIRFANLGWAAMPHSIVPQASTPGPAELLGANDDVVIVNQQQAHRSIVKLDRRMMQRSARSFQAKAWAGGVPQEPDRYYLNLESIRANNEGLSIDVHLHVEGQDVLLESVGLFGIKNASRQDLAHGGAGLTIVLDVTEDLDKLYLKHGIENLSDVEVVLIPRNTGTAKAGLTVERISLYRQQ